MVELTPRAIEYITARRAGASALDAEIAARIGDARLDQLHKLLEVVVETAGGAKGFDPSRLARPPKLV